MYEMESDKYPCPENFVRPLSCVFESMGMNSVLENHAVDHNVDLRRTEEILHRIRKCRGRTGVSSRIFWMIRCDPQRHPRRVRRKLRVCAACCDCGHGAPKAEFVFRVKAPDE